MSYCQALSDNSNNAIPASLRITPVQTAQSALSGVMREHMKPADIQYAQALIKTASQRNLSQEESKWLMNFSSWYDTWNNKFWDWYDNKGGREETAALKKASRVTAPQTGTQSKPQANGTPRTPEDKASRTPNPTPPTPPSGGSDSSSTTKNKTLMMVGLWAIVAIVGVVAYRAGKKK